MRCALGARLAGGIAGDLSLQVFHKGLHQRPGPREELPKLPPGEDGKQPGAHSFPGKTGPGENRTSQNLTRPRVRKTGPEKVGGTEEQVLVSPSALAQTSALLTDDQGEETAQAR